MSLVKPEHKRAWIVATAVFVTATVGSIVLELWYAFDGKDSTSPWTDLIVTFVPWELALAVYGALVVWIPIHFWVRYRKKLAKARADRMRAELV